MLPLQDENDGVHPWSWGVWAFATAILPFVDEVDPDAAENLYKRAWKLDLKPPTKTSRGYRVNSTKLGAGEGRCCHVPMVGDLYAGPVVFQRRLPDSSSNSKGN